MVAGTRHEYVWQDMRDPRINFRTRELAALLAFLIPGAGHYYQGRRLKAGIYFGGIVSLFFAGMVLGNWQPVYSQTAIPSSPTPTELETREKRSTTKFAIGYSAQFFTGIPALPALLQQMRFRSDDGLVTVLRGSLESNFTGAFRDGNEFLPVSGVLSLRPDKGGLVVGEFVGTTSSGESVSTVVSGSVKMGREVYGSPQRRVSVSGLKDVAVEGVVPEELRGAVARPFFDWYQAPRDSRELDRLHGKLSHRFDIACVFTWIAGLLNLMAIWDAYDGPAYGYGDEEPEEDDSDDEDN